MSSVRDLTATELREALVGGAITEEACFDETLSGIAAANGALRALVHFDDEEVRESFESRASRGPLAGVPVAVKDNIVVRGMLTTCASRILTNFRPPVDATAVARLRNAGAWIAGKSNLDEFAMGSSTEHSCFGATSNPWDLERVPGGSSGGSAAAVASRLVPVALGSDTGGSVRQPAAFCGVLGLKPTYGRVSRSGLVAFASSLDQIGIFSRSAIDCATVLGVIAGADDADSTSRREQVPDYAAELDRGIRGVRFGIVDGIVDKLDPSTRRNFDDAVALIRAAGGEISTVALPSMQYAIATYYIIANAEASANLARFDGMRYGVRAAGARPLGETYVRSRTQGFGAEVKRRIMLGTFALSSGYYDAYYGRAQGVRHLMKDEFLAVFRGVDALLTPTTPTPAFRKGEKIADPLAMYLSDIFTAPANLVGIPALAIPSGFSEAGLPLSLQVMGPELSESLLLRVARVFERESDAARRLPPR